MDTDADREVEMRIRAIIGIVCVALPSLSSAQRIPLPRLPIGGTPPGRELPPQPAPIANELAYKRWRLSVETAPMVSYIQTSGMTNNGATAAWTSLGSDTRADYLLNRNVSATLDLTSSAIGGPQYVYSAELGTRIHPEWAEHKVWPYVDLRFGYIAAYNKGLGGLNSAFPYESNGRFGPDYSHGWGGIVGSGFEYSFTQRWSLSTGAMLVRSRMTAHDLNYQLSDYPFTMTTVRYILGIRYNPVRIVRGQQGDTR